MPKLKTSFPRYCKHGPSGQAYVKLGGRMVYLGPHGTARSRAEYDRVIAEWIAAGRKYPASVCSIGISAVEMCAAYLRYAKVYYPQLQHRVIKAIQVVTKLYGRTSANDFSPRSLKACRQTMISEGGSRSYVNRISGQIKYMFKWAASEELVSHEVPAKLATVEGLRAGRTEAPETDPVTPVKDSDVEATLPYLPAIVADMVKLQRLTGVRPAELCLMRPIDIDRTDDVWVYRPASHKTQYRGKTREIAIGPKAQKVLQPYLMRAPASYCFAPTESVAQWRRDKRLARKSKVQPSQVDRSRCKPKRKPGTKYDTASYRRAIHRACFKAGVPQWSPNQLRHTMATEVRRQFGLEAAQVALGHSRADVTQIYAEKNLQLATEVAAKIG